MSAQRYAAMARKHWEQWLPKRVANLKLEGEYQQAIQTAGKNAQESVLDLMSQGFQQHEAEEIALKEFVLLEPEPEANEEPWEREELQSLSPSPLDSSTMTDV